VVRPRKISDFKPTFTNLAQTSHYQLIFGGLPLGVRQHLNIRGVDYRFMTETTGLLCSSAVIPGSTLADTKVIGNFQGVIENMTHARIYPDITLEFYVDKEYKVLKFFEHYIEFVAGGSREDQSKVDYYHQMEYPDDYKMYYAKLLKFDRDYDYYNEIQYNFYGMYPYQISNIPIRYETSQILKMSVNFHIDRYSSGKYSSYDKFRGRHNNKIEILADPANIESQSNVKQSEDVDASIKITGSNGELSGETKRLLDYGKELNVQYTYPYP